MDEELNVYSPLQVQNKGLNSSKYMALVKIGHVKHHYKIKQ